MVKSLRETARLRTLESLDNDEQVLCDARQHPFGIIVVYLLCSIGIVGAFVMVALYVPDTFGSSAQMYSIIALISIIVGIFLVIAMGVATYVYKQSRLTVTSKNVIQVMQGGLFTRKVSQISLANVEDVTSEQKGALAQIFGFGTLKIETAGEQINFVFNYAPQPTRIAKIILGAKDDFLLQTGQTGSVRNSVNFNS
jgi:membrane protein YdbS with pleckstrin-like domain